MANLNPGIGISNTLKPLFDTMDFPVVESNDVKGGIHFISTKSSGPVGDPNPKPFWQISANRRQIGMLVYVEDENKYYQIQHRNAGEFDNRDPGNFVEFQLGSGSNEWIDSVQGIYNDPSNIPNEDKVDGNRFIVGPAGTGLFSSQSNKIATYEISAANLFQGGYVFSSAPNGCTVRVDNDPTSVYKFSGTSSITGLWHRELQNTVRYIYPTSNNGLTYSYTSVGVTPLTGYTFSLYLASFATANSGTVSLSIDGGPYIPVRKVSSNQLVNLSANDFGANVIYQLSFDNGVFQIALPGSGSGGTIGPAENGDGTYTDGLYTDFTESTPIGTAIDRFNEILKALVPPAAPNLSSWNVSNLAEFTSGKISYSGTQALADGFNEVMSIYGYVGQGDLYEKENPNKYRVGVTDKTGLITGVLNSDVAQNTNKPIAAFEAGAIGNGITGSIVLYVNSQTASSVDLGVSLGQITDTTVYGQLNLSSATNSKFSTGNPFEQSWWRTGTYYIDKSSNYVKPGWNTIQCKHILPSSELTLVDFEFVVDSDITDTSIQGQSPVVNLSTPKFLSGIQYYTSGQVIYTARAFNIYRNTYYPLSDAGTFLESTTTAQSQSPIYNGTPKVTNSPTNAFSPSPGTQALPKPLVRTDSFDFSTSFNISTNVRKINGGATFRLTAKRTVRPTVTGGDVTVSNLFIDTYSTPSTDLEETFQTESRRLPNSDFNTKSEVDSANWDSSSSLLTVYRNALQVADGRLLYPSYDFTAVGASSSNPNFGIALKSTRDYSACGGNVVSPIHGQSVDGYRTYTRVFKLGSISYPNLAFDITYSGVTFHNVGTNLNSGAIANTGCYIEFKLPYSSGTVTGGLINGAVTGWLDATKSFFDVPPIDGAGCLSGSVPSGGLNWKINFGKRETVFSGGYVLMRITTGKSFQGYIQNIKVYPGNKP